MTQFSVILSWFMFSISCLKRSNWCITRKMTWSSLDTDSSPQSIEILCEINSSKNAPRSSPHNRIEISLVEISMLCCKSRFTIQSQSRIIFDKGHIPTTEDNNFSISHLGRKRCWFFVFPDQCFCLSLNWNKLNWLLSRFRLFDEGNWEFRRLRVRMNGMKMIEKREKAFQIISVSKDIDVNYLYIESTKRRESFMLTKQKREEEEMKIGNCTM